MRLGGGQIDRLESDAAHSGWSTSTTPHRVSNKSGLGESPTCFDSLLRSLAEGEVETAACFFFFFASTVGTTAPSRRRTATHSQVGKKGRR